MRLERTIAICMLGAALVATQPAATQPVAAQPAPAQPAATQHPASHPTTTQSSADPLDINVATPQQLNALPGFGPAYTRRVIAGRPYSAKNQLVTRGVIPQGEYERISDLIVAHRVAK